MRKFKLVKDYPNCPWKVGDVLENPVGCLYTYKDLCDGKYSEFWEEVKDEYPKIISFRGDGDNIATLNEYGTYTYNSNGRDFTKEHLLNVKLVTIHQVATSPTDVWTVGDKVRHKMSDNTGNITKINLIDGIIFFETTYCEERKGTRINNAIKLLTPLFTQEQKEEIINLILKYK